MKTRIFLLIIFATILCLPAWAVNLKLDPATVTAEVGDSFALTVVVEDVVDLFGASFEIAFDNVFLDAESVEPGDFLGQNVIFFDQTLPGVVSVAITKKAGDQAVAGSGILAEVTFTVKAEGETEVTFSRETLELNKGDGSRIPQFEALTLNTTRVNPAQEPPSGGDEKIPRLVIDPETVNAKVGDAFTLTIRAEDVVDLFGTSFELTFDDGLLDAQNVEPGSFLGQDVVFFDQIVPGQVSVAITKKAGELAVAGSGVLAEVTFTVKAEGETEITFVRHTLEQNKGDGSRIPQFEALTLGVTLVRNIGEESPHLTFEPSTPTINVGEPLVLAVVIGKVNELFGASLEVEFDQTRLEYQNAEPGEFLGTDVVFFDQAAPGKVSIAITKKAGAEPASGSGTLVEMTFTATAEGKVATRFIPGTLVLQKADESRIPNPTLDMVEITIESPKGGVEVELFEGINMMSIPLDPGAPWRLSNLAEAIIGDATQKLPVDRTMAEELPLRMVIWFDAQGINDQGEFITYMPWFPNDSPANKEVKVGDGYIVIMKENRKVQFAGDAWKTPSAAAPTFGVSTTDTTPVLIVEGTVEQASANRLMNGLNVTLKNQTTQQVTDDLTGFWAGNGQYILLLADFDNKRAARVGDELEIRIVAPSGELGGEILTHTVQPRDVEDYVVSIGSTSLVPKPKRSELLQNFPNPFNPETWIPFRLAHDADVTISIFATSGTLIRSLHLGHKVAASYSSKEKAAYWDGHNALGEKVSSGVYFYTIRADDFTAVRKLLILK